MNLKNLAREAYKISKLRESKHLSEGVSQSELLSIETDIRELAQQMTSSPGDFKSNATWSYYVKELKTIADRIKNL